MGVKYVLEGSVRREQERIRVTAQLVDAGTGNHIFSERYDRELKELFALQDDITMKVMTATRVQLTEGDYARAFEKGTKNLQAYLKTMESYKPQCFAPTPLALEAKFLLKLQNYPPFPQYKGDVLQTQSILPGDPRAPDKDIVFQGL